MMLQGGSRSSKQGRHMPSGSSGEQNSVELRFLTRQQSSSNGLSHWKKSSIQTALKYLVKCQHRARFLTIRQRSRRFRNEGGVRSFPFSLEDVGHRVLVAGREAATHGLDVVERAHVEVLDDKVNGRTNVEEGVYRVEVVDKVRG